MSSTFFVWHTRKGNSCSNYAPATDADDPAEVDGRIDAACFRASRNFSLVFELAHQIAFLFFFHFFLCLCISSDTCLSVLGESGGECPDEHHRKDGLDFNATVCSDFSQCMEVCCSGCFSFLFLSVFCFPHIFFPATA